MVNVYVHLGVRGLPEDVLLDDAFVEAIWRELPDAGLGGRRDALSITLSQWALSRDVAARRQANRVKRAISLLGWPDAVVEVDEVVRAGPRDDLTCLLDGVRWRLRH